jgi:hypothetical protein
VADAREALAWARSALRGIGDSSYSRFNGSDGKDIDWEAYRTLVRHCVSGLGHPMLWCAGERKQLLELAIEEGRAADPDLVVQVRGDYPHSRLPQAELPSAAEDRIETAYRRLGLLENA